MMFQVPLNPVVSNGRWLISEYCQLLCRAVKKFSWDKEYKYYIVLVAQLVPSLISREKTYCLQSEGTSHAINLIEASAPLLHGLLL